jgi:pSer/pThr/pTyr-binding forkhead associated (FHA) protein
MLPGMLVTEGPKRGIYIRFDEGEIYVMGRAPGSHFLIAEDPKISNRHCVFTREGATLTLTDQSTNGTKLNGVKIHKTSVVLKNADIIRLGEVHFQVVDLDQSSSGEDEFDFDACMKDIEALRRRVGDVEGNRPLLEYRGDWFGRNRHRL